MPTDLQKTVAGALLLGAGLVSGNAVLITAAGGIGVNWTSEGLAGLWQQARTAFAPGTALTRAGERAIRQAAEELRRTYQQEAGANADTRAFDLVRDCAAAVVVAQYPAGPGDPVAAQQALATALDGLLYGHEERQVAFIKRRLLETVAALFRAHLAADAEAWRLFHSWLIERLAAQASAPTGAPDRAAEVLAQLADQSRALAALDGAAMRIQQLIVELRSALGRLEPAQGAGDEVTFENTGLRAGGSINQSGGDIVQGGMSGVHAPTPTPGRRTSFRNQDLTATGDINQAGGNIYRDSAHVQGSGTAIVVNNPQVPPPPPPAESPSVAVAEPMPLMLTFTPTDSGAKIRWEAYVIGVAESQFTTPYQGDDLALVVRALDVLQFVDYPNPQGEAQRAWFSFSPAEQTRLADLGLWDSSGRVDAAAHRRVGRALFDALTADTGGTRVLSTARDHTAATGGRLALSLRFPKEAVKLGALPWELLWDDEPAPLLFSRGTLADCTRHLDLAQALPRTLPRPRPLRILAIVPYAGISPAQRQIEQTARQAAWRPLIAEGRVVMDEIGPATRRNVTDAIQARPPDIIHYYGHGLYQHGQGELLFDAPGGGRSWIGGEQLAVLFGGTRLVMLQACQGAMVGGHDDVGLLTGIAPALSAAGVQLVVGMQLTVRVEVAIRMSTVFYGALSVGLSVQEALNRARQALYVEGEQQCSWYVPVLYIRSRETGPVYI